MSHTIKSIGVREDLSGKTVLARLDLNVPCEDGNVRDDYRIKQSLPTLEFLRAHKAKTLIVSHFEGEGQSLAPAHRYLQAQFPVSFAQTIEDVPKLLAETIPGGVVLLENVRRFKGEKENAPDFARTLASFSDLFVNEAFAASHRAHASIVGVPNYIPGYVGFLFEKEVKNLSLALTPVSPSLFVLGGAKLLTKMPLLRKFISLYDKIFIAGGLVTEILSARGGKASDATKNILDLLSHTKIILPSDCIVANDGINTQKKVADLLPDERIVDIGPEGITELGALVQSAVTVLWNGPLGVYERGFSEATDRFADMLAESSAHTILGGGDTVASALKTAPIDSFSFVSTGGGAMLEFLTAGTLPGIQALEKNQQTFGV